jgi:hypothetical protein
MKTLILSAFVVLALASCKKDYVCSCTNSSTAAGSVSTVTEVTYVNTTKSTAKKACIKTTNDYTSFGITYTTTSDCKLK